MCRFIRTILRQIRYYFRDTKFLKAMLGIAMPIVLQMALVNSLSMVDMLMIGRLGEAESAAVGYANQMFFLVFLIFFGITSGMGIFVSQFWGDRDREGIHHVVGLSLVGTLLFAVPFAIASLTIPEQLMRILIPDEAVIELGAQYLRIIAPSYVFSGIAFTFAMALRSVEQPRIPLIATAVSMVLNTVLNLLLIFGLAGFPALGVKGAAIATCISRGVELIVILSLVYGKKMPVAGRLGEFLGFGRTMVRKFIRTVGPVLLNEIAWSMGMVVYKVVFARMGTEVAAATVITESIQGLFFVILIGSGNTAAIMIGKKIGEGDQAGARLYSNRFIVQSVLVGIIMGILMSASAPLLVRLLRMQPETIALVRLTLIALGTLIPIKAFNLHMIVGILRSGGDTTFSFLTELIGVWLIGVSIAFLAGIVLNLSLPQVYLLVGFEELFKLILTGWRFRSGKWLNDLRRTDKIRVAAEIPPVSDPAGS